MGTICVSPVTSLFPVAVVQASRSCGNAGLLPDPWWVVSPWMLLVGGVLGWGDGLIHA